MLEVGGLSETLTVSTAAPILQTTTSDVSDVISNEQVVQPTTTVIVSSPTRRGRCHSCASPVA